MKVRQISPVVLLLLALTPRPAQSDDFDRPNAAGAKFGAQDGDRKKFPGEEAANGHGLSTAEISLSIGVLVFGAIALTLVTFIMLRARRYWDMWSFKAFGLGFVLTAGIFLITAGYSQQQIAPLLGLLGTALGYLLGKESKDDTNMTPKTPTTEAVS